VPWHSARERLGTYSRERLFSLALRDYCHITTHEEDTPNEREVKAKKTNVFIVRRRISIKMLQEGAKEMLVIE